MEHECNEKCCCESSGSGCCSNSSCEESMDMGKMMMGLANEAWGELMKEKIKATYEKSIGDKMNKTAQVSAEACVAYWNNKHRDGASCAEFSEKLKKAMM